jgi:DNA-binding LacI/PurR family transcriptional regulator
MNEGNASSRGRKPRQRGRVREAVLRLIRSGALPPGQALPTEQELATLCRASQPTVNREIRRLIEEGVISVGADGQRMIGHGSTGLLARTIAVFTAYDRTGSAVPGKVLLAWESNLELAAEEHLMARRWRLWRLPAGDLSDAELAQISHDPPAGALVFADGLGRALATRVLAALSRSGTPAVLHACAEEYPSYDTAQSDHTHGGTSVVRWLAAHGCRRLVAHRRPFADGEPAWHAARQRGYRLGAQESGLPPPVLVETPAGIVEAAGEIRRFQSNAALLAEALHPWKDGPRPFGLLALSDGEVPAWWAACRRLDLHPGRDVLIAGYDGYWADLMERGWEGEPPSVSTDKCHPEMGAALADLLVQRLDGRLPPGSRHVLVEPRIVACPDRSG